MSIVVSGTLSSFTVASRPRCKCDLIFVNEHMRAKLPISNPTQKTVHNLASEVQNQKKQNSKIIETVIEEEGN